jgi:hypothetical protein
MALSRKIALVATQVKREDEDRLDVEFWLNQTQAQRLAEVSRLRRNYHKWSEGSFPSKMQKVMQQIHISTK